MFFDCIIFCLIIYISIYKRLLHTAAISQELRKQQSETRSLLVIQKLENIIDAVEIGKTSLTELV